VAYRRGVAAGATRTDRAGTQSRADRTGRFLRDTWRLTRETAAICFRYRVTGLAAEAGFFALLSLPPLVLGLVGSIGYLGKGIGDTSVRQVENRIIDVSARVLTADQVREVIKPTLRQVFEGGRFDIISIGFVLALWSGSRALNVFIDTISIMYGLGGKRGIVRTRVLSFTLYVLAVLIGSVVIPLLLVGPSVLSRMLPDQLQFLNSLYWPVASLLSVLSLTSLYHISVPARSLWRRDVPGALLTLVIWFLGSYVVRSIISVSVGGTSIYGPLTAPIVLLIWLYVLAIAVLIGAALNAAVELLWPRRDLREAREAVKARPVLMKRPGMDTGEIDLPLNRPPAELKRPEEKSAGPLG
jgi:membrane protein